MPLFPVPEAPSDGSQYARQDRGWSEVRMVQYNVLDYGVVADGVTDNTSEIADLINTTIPAEGGAVVFPPAASEYVIETAVVIQRGNIVIELQPGATLKLADSATGELCFQIGLDPDNGVTDVSIMGFGGGIIDANNVGAGIEAVGEYQRLRVDGVKIVNCAGGRAVYLGAGRTTDAKQSQVESWSADTITATGHTYQVDEKVYFVGNRAPGTVLNYGRWYWVVETTANTFKVSKTQAGVAINLETKPADGVIWSRSWLYEGHDVLIQNCHVENCLSGIEVHYTTGVRILNNTIRDTTSDDCLETSMVRGCLVAGNHVFNPGLSNAAYDVANDLLFFEITDNVFIDETTKAGTIGLALAEGFVTNAICAHGVIKSNVITGNFSSGINNNHGLYSILITQNNVDVGTGAVGTACQIQGGEDVLLAQNVFKGYWYGFNGSSSAPIISDSDTFIGSLAGWLCSVAPWGIHKFTNGNFSTTGVGTGQYHIMNNNVDIPMVLSNCNFSPNAYRALHSGNVLTQADIHNCVNFATRTSGTATVTNPATTIVVNHGIGDVSAIAPHSFAPKTVILTPATALGTAVKCWVSDITTTQFTINIDADAGAPVDVFWEARY